MDFQISNLSAEKLRRAAELKERLDLLQQELEEILGVSGISMRTGGPRNMSAAGRARIAAASRARWAKYRKERGLLALSRATAPEQKRHLSAAGRAAIVAAAKARWARERAQKSSN